MINGFTELYVPLKIEKETHEKILLPFGLIDTLV